MHASCYHIDDVQLPDYQTRIFLVVKATMWGGSLSPIAPTYTLRLQPDNFIIFD